MKQSLAMQRPARILFQTLILVLVLAVAASGHAFSNEEYKELMRVSPEFRAAEQQLTVTWKQVNAVAPILEARPCFL